MPADFTGGLEYSQDNLTDDMWGYNRYTKQEVRIASGFCQNEWKKPLKTTSRDSGFSLIIPL